MSLEKISNDTILEVGDQLVYLKSEKVHGYCVVLRQRPNNTHKFVRVSYKLGKISAIRNIRLGTPKDWFLIRANA